MKVFQCDCGAPLYFDARSCVACGRRCAYVIAEHRFTVGEQVDLCANGVQFDACNWQRSADHAFCAACQLNRTIPDLGEDTNRVRWQRIEDAKRRLLYTLKALGLPAISGHLDPSGGLLFDFMQGVSTGYADGVITLNVEEADDAAREAQRVALNETYRTLLGHLRHESGHYYLQRLLQIQSGQGAAIDTVRAAFGDFDHDYAAALQRYYADGPSAAWRERYISAYASAHPLEDWAETWSHYLHIYDVLDTAHAHGLVTHNPGTLSQAERLRDWASISVTLNELNRSAGVADAYPFVVSAPVARKLDAVDAAMQALR